MYDVFLSLRGRDADRDFINFLCQTLRNAKIKVFLYTNERPCGRNIKKYLVEVIRTCKIVIPIISENFAESDYCLLELTETLKCHRKVGKPVFPVFYKVDVDDVAQQKRNLGAALSGHELRFGLRKVREWRTALISVAEIRGWISLAIGDGREGELVEKVQKKVWSELWVERLPNFIKSAYLHFRGKGEWQVFLAFCSGDGPNPLAHLLRAGLESKGARVFRDDHESLIGGYVDDQLWDAIEQCRIHIPIISENFASSTQCLHELNRMVELSANNRTTHIFPFFHGVRRRQVRDASDPFETGMQGHVEQEGRDNYERWRHAFREVGDCEGWDWNEIPGGDPGPIVQEAVEFVVKELRNPQPRAPIPIHIL